MTSQMPQGGGRVTMGTGLPPETPLPGLLPVPAPSESSVPVWPGQDRRGGPGALEQSFLAQKETLS